MVSSVVATSAAALILIWMLVSRQASARFERRFEDLLQLLDEHLHAISRRLERAVERSADARESGVGDLGLTFDLDDLLGRLAAEAAARTGAEAAAARVRGPGDARAAASFGAEDVATLLEAALRPPDRRPFRALTVNWTFPPTLDGEATTFRSALLVPIMEDGRETGAVAAYARSPSAFRPEHARALEALAEEAAPAITSARRFAEIELRALARRAIEEPGPPVRDGGR